jgi:hypothetical protein
VIAFEAEKNAFEPFAKQILGAQFPQDPTQQTNPKQLLELLLDECARSPAPSNAQPGYS